VGGGAKEKQNRGPVPAVWGTLQISLIFMEDWVIACEMVGEGHTIYFTLKKNLKAKEELRKLKYFTMQKYNLLKNPLKETQNLSRYYYNSIL
jgi:hypothetical protein